MATNFSVGRWTILLTFISLLMFSSGNAGSLRCPSLVHVELGTDGVISCNIGFTFPNLYWYSGATFSETPPIVRLENGVPEGSDGFDITTNGSLVVLDVDFSQEGIYTVVVFHLNNTYEHSSVFMETFANPIPHFPVIHQCNGRQNCSIPANYEGSVQCSIYGARPATELDFMFDGVTLLNITHQNVTNTNTGLTDTTIQANYKSTECVLWSNITCIATGFAIQEIKSTLTFYNTCLPIKPTGTEKKGSAGVAVAITLVIIVLIAIAVVVTIYFFRRRRDDYQRVKQSEVEVTKYDNEYAKISQDNKPEVKNKKRSLQEKKNILLQALSEKYRADYFGNSSNADDRIISIDDVYIDLDFEVKHGSDKAQTIKINDMLKAPFTNDGKMKLFISNKMQLTFSSYFAYLWSEQNTKDNILFIFNMQEVSYDINIVTAIKEMLQGEFSLTEDDVIKVIEKYGCHIILEGVEVKQILSESEQDASPEAVMKDEFDTGSTTVTKSEGNSSSKWTIGNVVKDLKRNELPKNVFHWGIIFDSDSFKATDNTPYDVIQIKELTLFFDRIDDYIQKVVEYYYKNSTDKEKEEYNAAVKEIVQTYDLKKKFEKATALLIQMIHLITKQYIPVPNNATSNYISISSLLIKSLSLLKLRYHKKVSSVDNHNMTSLEEQLGEVAFNQIIEKQNIQPNMSEELIIFSKSIGLIKISSSANLILFHSEDVQCYLTASYMKDKDIVSHFIDQTTESDDYGGNDQRFQSLSFICALHPSYSHEICEKILKKGRIKYFLNCFCESNNVDEFHGVIKKYLEKEDNVISIYDDKPHLAKVRCLLKYCKKWKITVSRVKFERISQKKSQTTVVRTEQFDMPAVENITLHKIDLSEEETFVYYIEWLVKHTLKVVSFDNCKLPEFSASVIFALKTTFSQSKSKVVIKKLEYGENTVTKYELDKAETKWVLKGTKKKETDTKEVHQDKRKAKGQSTEKNTDKKQPNEKRLDQDPGKPLEAEASDKNLGSVKPHTGDGAPIDLESDAGRTVQAPDNKMEDKSQTTSGNVINTDKDNKQTPINTVDINQAADEPNLDGNSSAHDPDEEQSKPKNECAIASGTDSEPPAKLNGGDLKVDRSDDTKYSESAQNLQKT